MAGPVPRPVPVMPAGVADAARDARDRRGSQVVHFDSEPLDDYLLEWISVQDEAAGCRCERGDDGELILTAIGLGGGARVGAVVIAQVGNWACEEEPDRGEAYAANMGYHIPGRRGVRCCSLSWMCAAQVARLPSEHEQEGFIKAVPDFAVEIRSNPQSSEDWIGRIESWIEWGAGVAWMIDPFERSVHVARPGRPTVRHERPERLEVGPEMPGFAVDFSRIWRG